jgi:hypothetical protein
MILYFCFKFLKGKKNSQNKKNFRETKHVLLTSILLKLKEIKINTTRNSKIKTSLRTNTSKIKSNFIKRTGFPSAQSHLEFKTANQCR